MFTLPDRSFPTKEMDQMRQRLDKTILHIFGQIALNLIDKKEKPYQVTDYDVCRNGTMRSKSLRILQAAGALPYPCPVDKSSNSYYSYRSSSSYDYETLFNKHAKDYAKPIEFPSVPHQIDAFMNATVGSSFHMGNSFLFTTGYEEVRNLHHSCKIYAYYNMDLYDLLSVKGSRYDEFKDSKIYPKAMLETRVKAVLRSLMKKYCEEDILSFLNRKFDIDFSGQAAKDEDGEDDSFNVELRNYIRYPVAFDKNFFRDAFNSYSKEYKEEVDRINFEFDRFKAFNDMLTAAGGTKAVLEEFIKESLDNLVAKAPMLINGKDEDKDSLMFIMDHRQIITYDYLYN